MGGTSTETTTNKPLPGQYEELKKFWAGAGDLFDKPLQQFSQSSVAERDPNSIAAGRMTGGLGSEDYRKYAEQFITQNLRGDFRGGPGENPELDAQFASMSDQIGESYNRIISPGTNSRWAAAGRGTSPGFMRAAGQDQKNLGDIEQRRTQGGIEENYQQRLLDDLIQKFNFNQLEPEQRLDRYGARVGTNLGFGEQQTQSPDNSGLSIGLGAMGMLGKLGAASMMGPAAAAIP